MTFRVGQAFMWGRAALFALQLLVINTTVAAEPVRLPDVYVSGARIFDETGTGGPDAGSGKEGPSLYRNEPILNVDERPRRQNPACLREQLFMQQTQTQARSSVQAGQTPPGREIVPGRLWGNPEYSALGWIKMSAGVITRVSSPTGATRRYQVEVHYMWNQQTGMLGDFKFVNTEADGCDGVEQGT